MSKTKLGALFTVAVRYPTRRARVSSASVKWAPTDAINRSDRSITKRLNQNRNSTVVFIHIGASFNIFSI